MHDDLFGAHPSRPGSDFRQPISLHILAQPVIDELDDDVAVLIEEMCDYVNENWSKSPVHLAAYVLWRMNWIHPFVDGNGRTARALSYLVLSVRLGYRLPGTNTIPDQIASDKNPYYRALEDADKAFSAGQVDVSKAEALVEVLLANQLASVLRAAKSSAISKERDQAV